jgi:hypothetical protein
MFMKLLAAGASSLLGVTLLGMLPPPDLGPDAPPPPKKKGGPPAPGDDLTKAYNLLRRIRAEGRSAGRPEERIRDWTERASQYYRDGVKAQERGEEREAHEYGAIAHDLARAADHARNAALFDIPDDDLPPPPDRSEVEPRPGRPGRRPGDRKEEVRKDLRKAYDRIQDSDDVPGAQTYRDAARDLYNAARRDAEAGRMERAAELARAAEAMTHVVDHLGHLQEAPEPPGRERPKAKEGPEAKKRRPPEPKDDRGPRERRPRPDDGDLPPPL